jgi:hypothetical protein
LGHFFEGDLVVEGDLEPDPDVAGVPCVTGGPGDMPDGACTVFPPGTGSGIALRGVGDGAAGVAGANPLPEEPGAIVAGFGDCALAYDGGTAARAQADQLESSITPHSLPVNVHAGRAVPFGSRRQPSPAPPAALRRGRRGSARLAQGRGGGVG